MLENSGQSYEYSLDSLVSNEIVDGEFYIENTDVSGKGTGYGVAGERIVYPVVSFVLGVYSSDGDESNETSEVVEINGETSYENYFVYNLSGGEGVQLKPESVNSKGETLTDETVSVNVRENQAFVETSYSETEEGFGPEFVGEGEEVLNVDLSALGLVLNDGDLTVRIVHGDAEIVSSTVALSSGETVSDSVTVSETETTEAKTEMNITVEKPEEELPEETNTTQQPIIVNAETVDLILTEEDKALISQEFGESSLRKTKSEIINGNLIVRYEIGKQWIEYSYDTSLSQPELESKMAVDRMKWLKDLSMQIKNRIAAQEQDQQTQTVESYSI